GVHAHRHRLGAGRIAGEDRDVLDGLRCARGGLLLPEDDRSHPPMSRRDAALGVSLDDLQLRAGNQPNGFFHGRSIHWMSKDPITIRTLAWMALRPRYKALIL